MQRSTKTFSVDNISKFKENLLFWAQQFETILWLDSNNYKQQYSSFDGCLAVEEFTSIKTDYLKGFEKLKEYQTITKDYIFGYISYDVKNDVERLSSNNFDGLDFADLYFFQPQKLFFINQNTIEFQYLKMVDDEIDGDFDEISKINCHTELDEVNSKNDIKIKLRIHKDEYHSKVNKVLEHIKRGDIYEANFCQEFYAENSTLNPLKVYNHLNEISTPPFATFLKMEHQYLLSASPERYIKKEGTKIISQPIKGTAKRLFGKKRFIENRKNRYCKSGGIVQGVFF